MSHSAPDTRVEGPGKPVA